MPNSRASSHLEKLHNDSRTTSRTAVGVGGDGSEQRWLAERSGREKSNRSSPSRTGRCHRHHYGSCQSGADSDSGQGGRPHIPVRRRSGLQGRLRKKQAGDSFRWTGSGQIIWTVQVDRAGDYEIALNHAAEPGAVGQRLQVSSGDSRVGYTLAMTKGIFGDTSYETTPIKDRLRLEAGTQSITLSIPDASKAMVVLAFRSLELIPVAANAAIEAERQEARRARASTEW